MRVLLLTIFVVIADQFTKIVVKGISIPKLNFYWEGMDYGQSFNVIGEFFKITFVENPGMAFGIDVSTDSKLYLSLFSLVASLGIFFYLVRMRNRSFTLRFALALILGGAIGNLIDRTFYGVIYEYGPLFYGKVVDFFNVDFWDFTLFGHTYDRWPIFNIADAAVTVGVVIMIFFNWKIVREDKELGFGEKDDDGKETVQVVEEKKPMIVQPMGTTKTMRTVRSSGSSLPMPDDVPSMSAEDEFLMASRLGEDSDNDNIDFEDGENNNRKKS